jgi:hypothetical protein
MADTYRRDAGNQGNAGISKAVNELASSGRRRVIKPNQFSGVPTPELIYLDDSSGRKMDDETYSILTQELGKRGVAMGVQNKAAISDAGINVADSLAGVTGATSRFKNVARLSKAAPIAGSVLGAVQGVSQAASGTNPYGEGMPSGWNIPIDIIEGSYGYTGPFYPLAQAVFGGALSEMANTSNMKDERQRLLELAKAGKFDEIERSLMSYDSRDWDRGKLSQIFTSGLQQVENKRRNMFRTNFRSLTSKQEREAALMAEMEDRYNYDRAMSDSDFVSKSIAGYRAREAGWDADQVETLKRWIKESLAGHESARYEGVPSL